MAFLAGVVSALLGKNRKRTSLVVIPVVVVFMLVAGSTPSVMRAAVMIILVHLAPLFDRECDTQTALGVALFLILLGNPFAATHVGLQLSFASVAGILFASDRIQSALIAVTGIGQDSQRFTVRWGYRKVMYFIISVCSATFGAMLFTTPLTAYYFQTVSIISPVANLLCLWAISIVFSGGMFAGLATMIGPAFGHILSACVSPFVRYLNGVITQIGTLSFGAVSMNSIYFRGWLIVLYLLIALMLIRPQKRVIFIACISGVICLGIAAGLHVWSYHSYDLTVTALDVGQGQCIVLHNEDTTVVVDCGGSHQENPGTTAADYLQSVGVGTVEYLVLTHTHADHANGVIQLLQRIRIRCLILPADDAPNELYVDIVNEAQRQEIELIYISDDARYTVGSRATLMIYPPLGEKDINERGLSALLSVSEFDVLITGDMGQEVEQLLLSHTRLPDVEVLVVGHHGSSASTSEAFVYAANPDVAIISVGKHNSYGHPANDTLLRLNEIQAEIYRTDLMGHVTLQANLSD